MSPSLISLHRALRQGDRRLLHSSIRSPRTGNVMRVSCYCYSQHHHHQQQQQQHLHNSKTERSPYESSRCQYPRTLSTTHAYLSDNNSANNSNSNSSADNRNTEPQAQFSSIDMAPEPEGAVSKKLRDLIARGEIQPDDHQVEAALELDHIYEYLMTNDPPPLTPSTTSSTTSKSSSSFFGSLFGRQATSSATAVVNQLSNMAGFSTTTGAYMYGGVGCGKTFLMNLLYDAVDSGPWAQDKQKVHFHKFMLQVHHHMHEQRKLDPQGDLIAPVVDQILQEGRLLCLDEFQVTDVADAMILQQLFEGLWERGCILIATSNRPPSDLYLNGLQRERFLPFIDHLQQECTVIDLLDSETDYRMLAHAEVTPGKDTVYFTKGQSKEFRKLFFQLTEGHPANPMALSTQGRRVPIPLASTHKRVAHFEFADLCQKALGAADYLVIANHFSTVFCHNIPKLTVNEVNWLRRFITFVDTMYELKVTLVLHTQANSMDEIFVVDGDKNSYSQDEVFAFDRTRSRLEEMSSPKYLRSQWLGGGKQRHRRSSGIGVGIGSSSDTTPVVERKLTIHPSLDNHHRETSLAETSSLEAKQSSSSHRQRQQQYQQRLTQDQRQQDQAA